APLPNLSVSDVSVAEGTPQPGGGSTGPGAAVFTLSLSQASTTPVTVTYQTADGSATAWSGDYGATAGYVVFNPGETQKTIYVKVLADTAIEPDEAFTLQVTGAANAGVAKGAGTGKILNDDFPVVSVAPVTVTEGNSG